ncbi:hypothetical protein J1N35_045011 [Gossypium stocksii]|uniref:RNase H type-1 domain-containing protein n=1 Tax=Gossypium stocksii TaxID=47602 RepID=A0A9D3UAA7_9ROSI|nr:hypothetical protein J1N35_045011 [Gossypium stocksii]
MSHSSQKWEKPPIGLIKINVDATMADDKIGIGVVAWDSDGFVIGGITTCKEEHRSVEWAELCALSALSEGINLAHTNCFVKINFETDCASIVKRVRKNHKDITIISHQVKEIFGLLNSFAETNIKWIRWSKNKAADHFSRLALVKNCNFFLELVYPSDIHNSVISDYS